MPSLTPGHRRILVNALGSMVGVVLLSTGSVLAQASPEVMKATLAQPNEKTPEVSTEELRRILEDRALPSSMRDRPGSSQSVIFPER